MGARVNKICRKLAVAFAFAGASLVSVACNRVPGEALAMSIAPLPDGFEATTAPIPEGPLRSVPELCRAACDHWVKLRFLEPVGYNQLPEEARVATEGLLTGQRAANEETCRQTCERRGDRKRADCLLGLSTIESIDTCAVKPVVVPGPAEAFRERGAVERPL